MRQRTGWIVDVDIRAFFDTLDHRRLLELLQKRVKDGVIVRLVAKWLKAGVLEAGSLSYPETGTPQGGVISPILSNIYLHEVLDEWFEAAVKPRLKGRGFMVRYADDFVLLFRPVNGVARYTRLKSYLGRKGLKLNEAKTRVFDARAESFHFLGFRVAWRRSWRTGRHYPFVEPSPRRARNSATRCGFISVTWTTQQSCVATVAAVNRAVRGWSHYFHHGICTKAFAAQQLWQRQRRWLWRKYDRKLGLYTFFTDDRLHGQYQLFTLPTRAPYLR